MDQSIVQEGTNFKARLVAQSDGYAHLSKSFNDGKSITLTIEPNGTLAYYWYDGTTFYRTQIAALPTTPA